MYTAFAAVYDRLMRDVDYARWARFYASLLEKNGVHGGDVCECACGTGALTVALGRLGYRMTGVDSSAEMLSCAVRKAREAGMRIPFVRQDMCRLTLHKKQAAIVCTCDGVNYLLTPERLRRFFRAAASQLTPGGALIFDLSTPEKLRDVLGDRTLGSADADVAYLWQNAYHARTRTVELFLSIFVREADGRYTRLEERQTQRAYTQEEIREGLAETGFERVRFYGDCVQRAPRPGDMRWHVTARLPKGDK